MNRYAVLPVLALLGDVLPWADWMAFGPVAAVFAGWFGPMGVSALFHLSHSQDQGVADPGGDPS